MSAINKVPFLVNVLTGMSQEELTTLKQCVNGQGPDPVFRTLNPRPERLSVADKGVKPVKLELSGFHAQSVYNGYLIYNDTDCVLIAWYSTKTQDITLIKIDPVKFTSKNMGTTTIIELRSEIDDCFETVAGEVTVGDLATKADKVLLNDIKYEVEDNELHITLPQGVMPLRVYEPDIGYENLYFDYGNGLVIDSGGSPINNAQIIYIGETNQYQITLPTDYEELYISDMTFINIIGGDDSQLNTYKIYYPQSGTKLYRHEIVETSFASGVKLIIINTESTKYIPSEVSFISTSNGILKKIGEALYSSILYQQNHLPFFMKYIGSGMEFQMYSMYQQTQPLASFTISTNDYTDTVNEL